MSATVAKSKPDDRTLILGAGAAGLAAARELSNRGVTVTLIEARDRLGGRIHTLHERDWPAPLEMGAEFVHGKPPETWDVIRAARLTAYEVPDEHARLSPRGALATLNDFWKKIEPVMSKLKQLKRANDMTFDAFLTKFANATRVKDRDAVKLAKSYAEGFNAADATKMSAIGLRQAEEAGEEIGADTANFRLADGYDRVVEFFASNLDPQRVTFALNTIVNEVRWKRGAVELIVSSPSGGSLPPFRGRRLVVTLPLGVLKARRGQRGFVRFSPPITQKIDALQHLHMGGVVKALCRFEPGFFENEIVPSTKRARDPKALADMSFLHSADTPFQTWWTLRALRVPMLIGWAGGPAATKLSGKNAAALQRAAIDSLTKLLGFPRERIVSALQSCRIVDWQSDPFACGAYSYVGVGGLDAMKQLAQPIDNTLFFAGEATHWQGMSGTVAGATASGFRAAREAVPAD